MQEKAAFKVVTLTLIFLLVFGNSLFQIGHVFAAADVTKPVLNSIMVEPKEVTVGDTVKISIDAVDAETGIKSVYISYQTPVTEKLQGYSLKYNGETGKYEATINITDQIENGRWQLFKLSIEDGAGNKLELYNMDLPHIGESADLSSGEFVVTNGKIIKPLDQRVVTDNEIWTSETINGDVYIGPKAVLTINGNVTVNGNIYVLGALVSYGTFNSNGTIYAKSYTWGSFTTLYNGTVNIRAGINNIRSQVATNRPVEDIPLEIYTNPIIAENGVIKYLEGATLPIADMYVEGKKVDLRWNGTFYLNDLLVGNKENLDISFIDVFGTKIRKQVPLEVIDTIAPTAAANIPAGYYGSSKSIKLSMSEAGTIYYTLDGKTPTTSSKVYSGPIEINKTTTLKFLAVDKYGNQSEVYTEKYLFFTVSDVTDQSSSITGSAQPNATVLVKADKSEWKGTADESGEFTIDIPKLPAGTSLTILSTTKDGLESEAIGLTVKDVTAPSAPEVSEVTDKSTQVIGKTEVGAIIKVKAGDVEIGTGTAGPDGKFTINIKLQQAGSILTVTATDQAGNTSKETTVQVKDVTAPAKPVVNVVNNKSKQVTGKAEVGAKITVVTAGKTIGTSTVAEDGTFTVDIPQQSPDTTLIVTATDKAGNVSEETKVIVQPLNPSVKYKTHVQDYGWQEFVKDGELAGTEGEGKRLEAIQIELENKPYTGGITYTTHVQDYGWLKEVSDGVMSGTSGKAKRLEAIKMNLTGEMAEHYDIYYRVHVQDYGWLDWAKNGKSAGTAGRAKRLESIEIVLVEKGGQAPGSTAKPYLEPIPSIVYTTHVQDYGWLTSVKDGAMSGTSGKAKRLEGIKISLQNSPYSGSIEYTTHVQDYGWLKRVTNGAMSGTTGESKRLEAIQINLNGEIAEHYDIYYRVHIQDYGWLGWAKNGIRAGSEGLARRLEAIEIKLVEKGQGETVNPNNAFIHK